MVEVGAARDGSEDSDSWTVYYGQWAAVGAAAHCSKALPRPLTRLAGNLAVKGLLSRSAGSGTERRSISFFSFHPPSGEGRVRRQTMS